MLEGIKIIEMATYIAAPQPAALWPIGVPMY